MSELRINNNTLNVNNVVELDESKIGKASQAAKEDGADNVVFKADGATLVATGRGLDLKGIVPGTKFQFHGRDAQVIEVDNQVNSAREAVRHAAVPVGLISGSGVAYGLKGFLTLRNAIGSSMSAMFGLVSVLAGGLAIGGAALFGAHRSVNVNKMKEFGTTVE